MRRSEYVQCSPLTRPPHSAAQAALARVTACVLDRDNADPHSRVTLRLMFPKAQKQKVMILTLVMWLLKVESQILVHRAANVVQKRRMARWGQFYYVLIQLQCCHRPHVLLDAIWVVKAGIAPCILQL